jgi:hypothetical protein
LGVHVAKYRPDDAILAAGVHCLQHDQQPVLALRERSFLQLVHAAAESGDLVLRHLFAAIQAAPV